MSRYSIAEADIVPDRVPSDELEMLLRRPSTGAADTALDDIVTVAEAEFDSHLGGHLAEAANLALAKPQVIAVVIYRLHARRAANGDYKIPESVSLDWKAALAWAEGIGAAMLAEEGASVRPGTPTVQVGDVDAYWTRDQAGRL